MTEEPPRTRGGFSAFKEGWLKLVASYPNLPAATYAVAIVLSAYMNSRTRDAWPAMETLAKDINRTRSTVWRSIKRLEALKLLDVVHSRSRRKSNRYRPRLGEMGVDPKDLRPTKTPRGFMLQRCNVNAAALQHISCSAAARTSEEPQMKSRSRESEEKC